MSIIIPIRGCRDRVEIVLKQRFSELFVNLIKRVYRRLSLLLDELWCDRTYSVFPYRLPI
jgi:hypothetical protein